MKKLITIITTIIVLLAVISPVSASHEQSTTFDTDLQSVDNQWVYSDFDYAPTWQQIEDYRNTYTYVTYVSIVRATDDATVLYLLGTNTAPWDTTSGGYAEYEGATSIHTIKVYVKSTNLQPTFSYMAPSGTISTETTPGTSYYPMLSFSDSHIYYPTNQQDAITVFHELEENSPPQNPDKIWVSNISKYSADINFTNPSSDGTETYQIGYSEGFFDSENATYSTHLADFQNGVMTVNIPDTVPLFQPNTNYYVRVAVLDSQGEPVYDLSNGNIYKTTSFTTMDETNNVYIEIGNVLLREDAQVSITSFDDIKVTTEGYESYTLTLNGTEIHSEDAFITSDGIFVTNVLSSQYASYTQTGENVLVMTLTDQAGSITTRTYSIWNSLEPPPTDPYDPDAPTRPTEPVPPNSGWDMIGWLSYIVDWIIYLVEAIIWVLGQTVDIIYRLFSNAQGLISTIAMFFDFLPPEIIALMTLGLTIAILLRVFNR